MKAKKKRDSSIPYCVHCGSDDLVLHFNPNTLAVSGTLCNSCTHIYDPVEWTIWAECWRIENGYEV